jgi:CHAT domain-containing protein
MVMPGSNGAKAGFKPGDVLLRYGDTDLNKPADLKPQPEAKDPDKRVPVVVWREGTTGKLQVRPGKLGVGIAQEPAPKALAEQRRIDRLLGHRGHDDGEWPRLPGTRFEAASLQRLFGTDSTQLLLDSDASEQRLDGLAQRGELIKYRYIHLATNGETNDVFPLRSAVILARDQLPDERERTDLLLSGKPIPDGRLEAEEILQRWQLDCDLVTLSACQTALGRWEQGEGFVGFSQALILAGSRSMCLSLWKVDDTATALLMTRFYENLLGKREGLKSRMPKAEALAEAKTWLQALPREEAVRRAAQLSNSGHRGKGKPRPLASPFQVPGDAKQIADQPFPFAHPFYWAAFILIGDHG